MPTSTTPSTAIIVFTRDLRLHDNPVLAAAAAAAECVLPVFIHDTRLHATGFAAAPRQRYLTEALADLDDQLRRRGGALLVRRGDLIEEVCRLAERFDSAQVHIAADVSAFATRRQRRLGAALAEQRYTLVSHQGVHNVVAPGVLTPQHNDHFAVFTPYHRRWVEAGRREQAKTPPRLRLPPGLRVPAPLREQKPADGAWRGGERHARRRVERWLEEGIGAYHERHDDLAGDATSRLSPDLHLGTLSARELADRAEQVGGPGAESFVRQMAWRDFHHQVLAARPDAARADYRPRGDHWREDPQALQAWQEGTTGIPIVDAGMRQLAGENWMHNRARLIVASFLTKTLYLDWRAGAAFFTEHLLDADIANNQLNWQWVAGTGTDSRPNRVLNPLRQAARYDPAGEYVRRWVPELAGLDDPREVHQPWRLGASALGELGYPAPIVDLDEARERFQQHRRSGAAP